MRIATWNINGLRARIDFVRIWLEDRQPDLVGLQELKLTDDKFPHAELEEIGYRAVTHGQKSWNGVAILSRDEVEVTQVGLPGQEEFGARLITAQHATGDLSFTTVYCPNGKHLEHEDYPKKLAWFDSLIEHFQGTHSKDAPTVLCGDFNICPAAIDSWDEKKLDGGIFHTAAERNRIAALKDWGLTDLFRAKYPDEQKFSWWDYRGGSFHRNQGLRIDFHLATEAVQMRLEEVWVDRDYRKKKDGLTASDHAPVIADLQ